MCKKKKFIALLIIMVLSLSSVAGVSAADETYVCDCEEYSSGIELYGFTSTCPVSANGKHLMSTKGLAHVYNGPYPSGKYVFTGYESQCIHCYLVLVTANPAHLSNRPVWGQYAMVGANEPIPSQTPVYTTTFGTKNSHDSFTAGFDFTYVRRGLINPDEMQ